MGSLISWLRRLDEIPCKRCGCRDTHNRTVDWIGSVESEKEVICDECGLIVNYWAYGSYEKPFTYTESIQQWWATMIFRWKNNKRWRKKRGK